MAIRISGRVARERAKDAVSRKVTFRGAGGAIFGNSPAIKNKEQADRVIAAMLGRKPRSTSQG
jgi:hypothetical protein